jgi:hypothetical protein
MLAGARAFDGESFVSVGYRICHTEPSPIQERAPCAPEELAVAVDRLLRKVPEERFPSASGPTNTDGSHLAFLTLSGEDARRDHF